MLNITVGTTIELLGQHERRLFVLNKRSRRSFPFSSRANSSAHLLGSSPRLPTLRPRQRVQLVQQRQRPPTYQMTVHRTMMDAKLRPSHSGMFPATDASTRRAATPPRSAFLQKSKTGSDANNNAEPNMYLLLAQRAAMAMGMVYVVTEYVADITLCEGPSMSPTIRPYGEIVLIDKYSIRRGIKDGLVGEERRRAAVERQKQHGNAEYWHEPVIPVTELQDKVPWTWRDALRHFRSPLAIGDVVVSEHPSRPGTVCKRITGLPGDQILKSSGGMLTVPDGHVWLEGDNPQNSSDSRSYGALPVALLQGRVVARLWPLRGGAWLRRGARPHGRKQQQRRHNNSMNSGYTSGSTVLPAGYQGEHIVKHVRELSEAEDDEDDDVESKQAKAVKRGTSPS